MLLLSHMGYCCCEECMLLWITARMLKKETFNQFLILFFFQNVCSIALNDDSRCIMYNFLWCPFFLRCISFIILTIYNFYKFVYTIHVVPDNKTWFRSQHYTITRHFPDTWAFKEKINPRQTHLFVIMYISLEFVFTIIKLWEYFRSCFTYTVKNKLNTMIFSNTVGNSSSQWRKKTQYACCHWCVLWNRGCSSNSCCCNHCV